jgi:hypothetical protein
MNKATAKRGLRREFFATRGPKPKETFGERWGKASEAALKEILKAFKKQTD